MPMAPPRPCRNRSCGKTTTTKDGWCDRCRPVERARANVSTPERIARQRHYHTKAHQAWRREVLSRDPVCVVCHDALSTHADHKLRWYHQPEPYAYALDSENGQGMCSTCHNRKSGREAHQGQGVPSTSSPEGRGGVNLADADPTYRRGSPRSVQS